MSWLDLAGLLFLCALIWLWFDSVGARDAGIEAARFACESENLQLLDDTLAIASVRLTRNDNGQVCLRRVYKFEFSDTGNNRRNGRIVLLGARVVEVNIGLRLVRAGETVH